MENNCNFDENNLPLVMSVIDVQDVLKIGRVKAYEVVHMKGFPKIMLGKRIVIPREPFLNWLNTLGGVI